VRLSARPVEGASSARVGRQGNSRRRRPSRGPHRRAGCVAGGAPGCAGLTTVGAVLKPLTAVLTSAHSVAPARGSRGLDTKDEALIDDVVIVKIIVASRRDALIEALGIASDSPDGDRSQIHLVPGLPLFDKS
jgi:hypothetical protein